MKKVISVLVLIIGLLSFTNATTPQPTGIVVKNGEKIDIKIKNDRGDEVTVYNAGSGGTYRLTKNATTTINGSRR
ncbi:MAG: hypothetical protein KA319_00940 [Ferruginibacter sp.]|nr:hypothetical protein [Ferruginibacter sp.]